MSTSRIVPPLDYLKQASRASLQSFELARLNHAANLRREIGALIDQWIKEASEAMLARWMLDQRDSRQEPRPALDFLHNLSKQEPESLLDPQAVAEQILPRPPRFSNPRLTARSASVSGKTQRARSATID